jgi:hypothetical protein
MEKDRELKNTDRVANVERARLDHERQEKFRLSATADAFGLVFQGIAASEDLLRLSRPEFDNPKLSAQRTDIREHYNSADAQWRKQHALNGFNLTYYWRRPDIASLWVNTDAAVTAFMDCAGKWIVDHPRYTEGLDQGCVSEKHSLDTALQLVESTLVGAGQSP